MQESNSQKAEAGQAAVAVRPEPPSWLKVRLPFAVGPEDAAAAVRRRVRDHRLHTVCEEAACPNLGHCWSRGTATFLVMGDRCTRRCTFCHIATGRPLPLDPEEAQNVARTVKELRLRHVVITSVDRDELADCGSAHFADVIQAVRQENPAVTVEVLIPDFKGRPANLERIWAAGPDIINHNVETVPSLYRAICPQSKYATSLEVLRLSAKAGFTTKSGIILGLGERDEEVEAVLADLRAADVRMLTMGQYLAPSPQHAPVKRLIPPEVFAEWRLRALALGFAHVEAGPLVRSSYHAGESAASLRVGGQ